VARRRRRLQELAEELHRAEDQANTMENDDKLFRRRMQALRSLGSERELTLAGTNNAALDGPNEEDDDSDFEQVSTTRRLGSRGTDYWPVSLRARYHPAIVAMRVKTTSQEYINFVVLWSRFLMVLAVAVAFSLWRGPKDALGLRRLPPTAKRGRAAIANKKRIA